MRPVLNVNEIQSYPIEVFDYEWPKFYYLNRMSKKNEQKEN